MGLILNIIGGVNAEMKCEQVPSERKPQESVLIQFLQKSGVRTIQDLVAAQSQGCMWHLMHLGHLNHPKCYKTNSAVKPRGGVKQELHKSFHNMEQF